MKLPQIMFSTMSSCSWCNFDHNLAVEVGVYYEFTDLDLLEGEERAALMAFMKKLSPRWSFINVIIG